MSFDQEFEWDEAKAALNQWKHGVPFDYAARVFLDEHRLEYVDDREDYGEVRFVTIGRIATAEVLVVYTMRGNSIRIISAREAEPDEVEEYWNR